MVTEPVALHRMAESVTRPVLSPDEQLVTSLSFILIAVVFGFLAMRVLFPWTYYAKRAPGLAGKCPQAQSASFSARVGSDG